MTLISKHRLERSCSEGLDVVFGICHQHLFSDAEARKRTVLTGGVEQEVEKAGVELADVTAKQCALWA